MLNVRCWRSKWLDKTLSPEEVERYLLSLPKKVAAALQHNWEFFARPDQLPPPGNTWQVWLYLAGRGSGKTRAGVEWVRNKIKRGSGRIALISPTTSATRDVLIEGESGILPNAWEHDRDDAGNHLGRPLYEPSKRRLTWANGAIATAYSAEEPDRLRGPQHDCLLADELAAWFNIKTEGGGYSCWDMAMKQTPCCGAVIAGFDPAATLAVHCGNNFDTGFYPYQSTRSSRYNTGS
jgi:Terminase large subunit, T4likevirus-type, N-terminal